MLRCGKWGKMNDFKFYFLVIASLSTSFPQRISFFGLIFKDVRFDEFHFPYFFVKKILRVKCEFLYGFLRKMGRHMCENLEGCGIKNSFKI